MAADDSPRVWMQFYFNLSDNPPALVAVLLTMQFVREDQQWVGTCVELGTSTYGDDLDDVADELEELVLFHLNSLEADGERENFFERHQIEPVPFPAQRAGKLLDRLRYRAPASSPSPVNPMWLTPRIPLVTAAVA